MVSRRFECEGSWYAYSSIFVGSGACSNVGVAAVVAAGSWPCAATLAAAYRAARSHEELASFLVMW